MKVKATAVMSKFLNENIPECTFTLEKMSIEAYRTNVDINYFYHSDDWNSKTNLMQVIKVTYPADFYAIDRFLTTSDLRKLFSLSDKTVPGFLRSIKNEIEI
jgi:hypothetical protein